MTIWHQVWLTLAGLVGLVWLARAGVLWTILRRRLILGSRSGGLPPEPAPKISLLVAAKDEEENIATCLTSLLRQDYPNFEVVVIDDRSRDRTPQILKDLVDGAGARLGVVTVNKLREGWFGKNNAMREGVETATGDWLCFTDADCRQTSPRTLTVAMGEALEHDVDFLSITPVLEARTVWDRVTQPVCALVLMSWFLPSRVNDPDDKTAYANGAFMLMRRTCYEAIGGHERVRAEVNEDIHMACLAKRQGLRLRVVENDDLYRTRMYRTPGEAWRGWSRIFYGSLVSLPRLMVAALFIILFTVLPWVSLAVALIGFLVASADAAPGWAIVAGAWLIVIALKQSVLWRVYPVMHVGRLWSLTYVVGAVIALGMLISAMFKAAGATSTTWRGTTYRGHRFEENHVCAATKAPASGNSHEESLTDA